MRPTVSYRSCGTLIIQEGNAQDDAECQRADERSWSAFLDLLEEVL